MGQFEEDSIQNCCVNSKVVLMTLDELYAEYEKNLNIVMNERDKIIFRYAYFVGKNNLDKKE